jgi:hypothetical protein
LLEDSLEVLDGSIINFNVVCSGCVDLVVETSSLVETRARFVDDPHALVSMARSMPPLVCLVSTIYTFSERPVPNSFILLPRYSLILICLGFLFFLVIGVTKPSQESSKGYDARVILFLVGLPLFSVCSSLYLALTLSINCLLLAKCPSLYSDLR